QSSKGTFVALLDSDDWWAPEKVEMQLRSLTTGPWGLCSTRVEILTSTHGRKIVPARVYTPGERVEEFWFVHRGLLQTSTLMARRETMIKLLDATVDSVVHNDPAIVLEAQRR